MFQYDLAKTVFTISAVLLQIGTTGRGLLKSCGCWPEAVNLFDALLLVVCTRVDSDLLFLDMNNLVLFASHASAVSVIHVCHALCLISFSTGFYYGKSGAAMLRILYAFMTCHYEMTKLQAFV